MKDSRSQQVQLLLKMSHEEIEYYTVGHQAVMTKIILFQCYICFEIVIFYAAMLGNEVGVSPPQLDKIEKNDFGRPRLNRSPFLEFHHLHISSA